MRYETLVARFWLRVRGVPQSSCRRQSRDKDKSSGVENENLADNRDMLFPDPFSHGSRSSTSRSEMSKLARVRTV